MERRVVPVGAVVLTTFFALLYALRGSIALLDRGEDPRWAQQVGWSLAMWWTCLPFLPPLAALVRRFPVGRPRPVRAGDHRLFRGHEQPRPGEDDRDRQRAADGQQRQDPRWIAGSEAHAAGTSERE